MEQMHLPTKQLSLCAYCCTEKATELLLDSEILKK